VHQRIAHPTDQEPIMQNAHKPAESKTPATRQPAGSNKTPTQPTPLDPKALPLVGGGALPKHTW
jgi:hypothetical protein